MDIVEGYRSTRQGICAAWKHFTAMGSLRFPDAVQERRFVQHAGEHGLSVMRSAPCPELVLRTQTLVVAVMIL